MEKDGGWDLKETEIVRGIDQPEIGQPLSNRPTNEE